MKKKYLMILAAALTLSLAACGSSKENTQETETEDTATEEESGSADTQPARTAESKADKISYEVLDYVELGDYSNLQISLSDTYEVTEDDIQAYAQQMAEYYAGTTYKDTDKKTVEEGDIANIDYVGKKDGVAFDGGTASGYNLAIGSGTFIDGFEDGLIGKKVGQTVDLNLTFPEDYQSEELAGADVVFTVTINKIVEEDTEAQVELTDEFVSSNFGYDTVESFMEHVKEYLESSNEQSKNSAISTAVLNKLQEICTVTLPDGLLEARVADYIEQFTQQNCQNTDLESYLSSVYNMTPEDFEAEITSEMQETLNHELVLAAITEKEKNTLEDSEWESFVDDQMTSNNYSTQEELFAANGVNAESGENYLKNVCLYRKTLEQVIGNADIQYGVKE